MAAPERVLIRAPNWLGDCCLSLPAVRDVRRNLPRARIEVLARGGLRDLYAAVPEVDATRDAAGFADTVESLAGGFDAAVLLTNSFRTALEVFLARIPERWGYASDGRGPLLTRRAWPARGVLGRSELYYYRAMLAGIGLATDAPPDASLSPLPGWRERGRALLGAPGERWVGLSPGAFYGSAKRWIPERYALVADRLARRHGVRVAILGGPAERPAAAAIAGQMQSKPRLLCGETSLGELAGVLAELELLLTNDSGPMHLAGALGVPVVAVFGPTDWRETAPLAARQRLVREPVPCAPCKLRECPVDHACMKLVTAERVAAAAEELLAEPAVSA